MTRGIRLFWRCRRAAAALACAGLACAPAAGLRAQAAAAAPSSPEAVKAAYVLNFLRFTEWPASALPAGAPFVVGVSADRALEDELLRITEGQQVRGRRIRVLRVRGARDLEECHLVWLDAEVTVNEEPAPTVSQALQLIDGRPVLTVSSHDGFVAAGGMLNLYRDGNNLRFEIAQKKAEATGLRFSAQLLRLARIVDPPRSEP